MKTEAEFCIYFGFIEEREEVDFPFEFEVNLEDDEEHTGDSLQDK